MRDAAYDGASKAGIMAASLNTLAESVASGDLHEAILLEIMALDPSSPLRSMSSLSATSPPTPAPPPAVADEDEEDRPPDAEGRRDEGDAEDIEGHEQPGEEQVPGRVHGTGDGAGIDHEQHHRRGRQRHAEQNDRRGRRRRVLVGRERARRAQHGNGPRHRGPPPRNAVWAFRRAPTCLRGRILNIRFLGPTSTI